MNHTNYPIQMTRWVPNHLMTDYQLKVCELGLRFVHNPICLSKETMVVIGTDSSESYVALNDWYYNITKPADKPSLLKKLLRKFF